MNRPQENRADDYAGAPTLRERGWTDAMIRDLLGKPDKLRPNPRYRSAAPMRLWAWPRVHEIEGGQEFAARMQRARARSASSRAAADHRRDELLARVQAEPVPASGIHVRLLIMVFRGVGTRKGAPDLGECGLL